MSFYFNPSEVNSSSLLPDGTYTVMVTAAKDKGSKNGGSYLELTLAVLKDEYKHITLFDKLNYLCSSAKAMEIAKRNIATVIQAKFGDKREIHEEAELIDAVVEVVVDSIHDDFKNEMINRIKFYKLPKPVAAAPEGDVAW